MSLEAYISLEGIWDSVNKFWDIWGICEFNILWMLTLTSEEAADSHMAAPVQI